MLYRITCITRPNGQPATTDGAIKRIGREGRILQMELTKPFLFAYAEPDTGTLQTTPVTKLRDLPGRTIQITTRRHIYNLREVEPREEGGAIYDKE